MKKQKASPVIGLMICVCMIVPIFFIDGTPPKRPVKPQVAVVNIIDHKAKLNPTEEEIGQNPPVYDIPLSEELQAYTWEKCQERNLDYEMVLAIMHQESRFDPRCISRTNDYGIMQINIVNHQTLKRDLGITNFLDPYQSINAGTYILAEYGGSSIDPNILLMAYNMGPTGANEKIQEGITKTAYSESVLNYASSLKKGDGEHGKEI